MRLFALHRLVVVLPGLLLAVPQMLEAQYQPLGTVAKRQPAADAPTAARWEVTPQLGMYMPVQLLTHAADDAAGQTRRQVGAAGLGARVGLRIVRHFGLEGSVFYSPSLVAVAENGTVEDLPAGVLLASARGVVRIGGTQNGGWNLYVAPGLGLIVRQGSAWEGTSGIADPAVVLAAGSRVPLGKSGTAFRIDLENYMSRAQFETQATGPTKGRIQHDFILSTGFVIPVRLQ